MILGIDDITGGATILSFIIWLGLTFAYYIVCYLAVINIINDLNTRFKIALLLTASLPASFLMAVFNYQPIILGIFMGISNFHRIKALNATESKNTADLKVFYNFGYLYIVLICAFAAYLQTVINGGE